MRVLTLSIATILIIAFTLSCSSTKKSNSAFMYNYTPDDRKLYDTIVYLDSVFFQAYNTCNLHLKEYASFYSDSIEFYHDKGGMMNSKKDLVDATERNICGKVTRELVKGSIEVYPINNYGAVEMGIHKFHNNIEPANKPSHPGKFVIIWQHKNNEWKISRVISLH